MEEITFVSTKFATTNNDWLIKLTERVSSGVANGYAVFDRSFECLESLMTSPNLGAMFRVRLVRTLATCTV